MTLLPMDTSTTKDTSNTRHLLESLAHLTRSDNKTDSEPGTDATPTKARPISERVKSMSKDKLHDRILRATGKAIGDFNLIEEGDRVLVAISGGKDSWVLLQMLKELQKKAPIKFELVAINIDQGYKGFRQDLIEDYVTENDFDYKMEEFDIADILTEKIDKGEVPCSLCSRLRRGALYGLAEKNNCNKIALGHHLDDFIETLMLNTFFVGRLAAMSPKLKADDGKNTVIRPLVYVTEAEIKAYAMQSEFPIVCCACPLACGGASHIDSKRRMVKQMMDILEQKIPNIRYSLLKSLSNVQPRHLLDKSLWGFK